LGKRKAGLNRGIWGIRRVETANGRDNNLRRKDSGRKKGIGDSKKSREGKPFLNGCHPGRIGDPGGRWVIPRS